MLAHHAEGVKARDGVTIVTDATVVRTVKQ
jgi:hypothetical protein